MGISSLRPFLQSLCCNSPWNYAVFWKLKLQPEMILVWEDGFSDILKPRDTMVGPIEDLCLENANKILYSTFSSSALDGTPGEYPVGLAVAEMSSASHAVGKGAVGKVAFTGNARWIYSDNIATDVFNSVLVTEYPDEWLLQFAAGIKTVLLLPVNPHGVLQLGSVEVVAEDATFMAHVKDMFEANAKSDGYDWTYTIQQFSLMSNFTENLEEPSTIPMGKVNEDQKAIHAFTTNDCNLFANQMVPVFMVQDSCNTSMKGVTNTLESMIDSEINQQTLAMIDVAEPCQLSCEDDKFVVTENNILKSLYFDEEVRPFPHCDNFDRRIYGDLVNNLTDYHFEEGATEPTFVGNDFDNAFCESGSYFFSFPGDCELQKALGPTVVGNTYQYTYDSSISGCNAAFSSIGDKGSSYSLDTSGMESARLTMKEFEVEHLLEDVVANACSSSDDNSSNSSNVTSINMSSGKLLASSKRPSESKCGASVEEDTVPWSFLTSAFIAQERNTASNLSASVSSVKSQMSALADKQQHRKGYDSPNPGKLSRLPTTNKRRVRVGDNQRTRPRDRQLIQDRIKELRELVPYSEKCSIDGLLDKTIKHMQYLRSVTNRADKLRCQVLKEESHENTSRTAEVNYGHQNGASWAVELGNEQQLCPIVVKDLNHPGHMLIEMLCTDHGRFLEIADVIHRLQLTILKGVMEKSSDNSLARFFVETSGSFQRLDIFWPLMQLLQQSRPLISSMT